MDALQDLGVFEEEYDYTFFDVLGDVVCGGFAKPIQKGYAKDIFIVTSGEFMSLYAANNIAQAIKNIAETSPEDCCARFGGIIGNLRGLTGELQTLLAFADRLGTRLLHCIPRDPVIQSCERRGMTVLQGQPSSPIAAEYRDLAAKIGAPFVATAPGALSFAELVELCRSSDQVAA